MRARPYQVELASETQKTLNRIVGAVEIESAAQDIHILKLYRFWEEAKKILIDKAGWESIFQHILYTMINNEPYSKQWNTYVNSYLLDLDFAERREENAIGLRKTMNDILKSSTTNIRLDFDFCHIPESEVLQFILEQCAYWNSQQPQGNSQQPQG